MQAFCSTSFAPYTFPNPPRNTCNAASPSTVCADAQNLLIEATAVDEHKAAVTVNQIVAAFSYYCKLQFTRAAPPSPSGQGRNLFPWSAFISKMSFSLPPCRLLFLCRNDRDCSTKIFNPILSFPPAASQCGARPREVRRREGSSHAGSYRPRDGVQSRRMPLGRLVHSSQPFKFQDEITPEL